MNAMGRLQSEGCHVNFAHDALRSYFDECQKNEIHLLNTAGLQIIFQAIGYFTP